MYLPIADHPGNTSREEMCPRIDLDRHVEYNIGCNRFAVSVIDLLVATDRPGKKDMGPNDPEKDTDRLDY